MIDAEKIREYLVSLMVIQKQTREKLPEIENRIKELELKKKTIEEKIQKEQPQVKAEPLIDTQPGAGAEATQSTQPVINPELLAVENELAKLNSKRAQYLADIDEAQMEIDKAKSTLTHPANTTDRAEELLNNLQGAAGKIDDIILKKKNVEMDAAEELRKMKENQKKQG